MIFYGMIYFRRRNTKIIHLKDRLYQEMNIAMLSLTVSMEWHLPQVEDGMTERIIGEKITYTKEKITVIGVLENMDIMKE
nr:MAG TPA: hypothetical protein [Caudoviricetes sp.]